MARRLRLVIPALIGMLVSIGLFLILATDMAGADHEVTAAEALPGTTFATNGTDVAFRSTSSATSGDTDIVGTMFSHTFTGHWAKGNHGSNDCGTDGPTGTTNWGRLVFVFNADYSAFTGQWAFCEDDPSIGSNWNGTAKPPDPCAVPEDELPAPPQVPPGPGMHEVGCYLYLNSPPGGSLNLTRAELPDWAEGILATSGASIAVVGAPDTIITGDLFVTIDNVPAAWVGSLTAQGGEVLTGSKRIFVNYIPAAVIGGYAVSPMITGLVPHQGGPIMTTGEGAMQSICVEHNDPHGFCTRHITFDFTIDAGATVIEVDAPDIEPGELILVGDGGPNPELAVVEAKGSLILESPLTFSHPAGSAIVALPPALQAVAEIRCEDLSPTVLIGAGGMPTNGDDVIVGTSDADTIDALDGDDVICALGGADTVDGGAGRDRIDGGGGADILRGGLDVDRIWGRSGGDTIDGGGGSDRIFGGPGNDQILGGSGADRLYGDGGADIISGMGGQDLIHGDSGRDELQGNHQSDNLYGGSSDDVIRGAGGKDVLYGEGGDDDLYGGDNTDYLHGGSGLDQADGQRGHDNPLVHGVSGCVAETKVSC